MEEKLRNNLLLDFYGNMLTEKQRQIMVLYIEEDTGLSEIATMLKMSRQAVYDAVKSSENTLKTFEDKLKCVERFLSNRAIIIDAVKTLENMPLAGENNKKVNKIIENLKKVLKNQ
jgi:predicted DNA-binding protein YlxM (UPF0122 family)